MVTESPTATDPEAGHDKWLIDAPRVLELGVITTLKAGLVHGQIDIVAHDEPTTRIEVHAVSGKGLRVDLRDGRLEIDHPQLRWDNWIETMRTFTQRARADVSVLVPRDVAVTLGVVSASALLSGVRGDAKVSTVSGDVVLDGVTGSLSVDSVSGEVTLREHDGTVSVHTVSGDVTAAGAIRRFRADSVSADLLVDASGVPDEIAANTVAGAVTVRLDAGIPASYAVSTVGGSVRLEGRTIHGLKGRYTESTGDLSGRWVDLRANTVGGDITVLRRGAEA